MPPDNPSACCQEESLRWLSQLFRELYHKRFRGSGDCLLTLEEVRDIIHEEYTEIAECIERIIKEKSNAS